jgi:nitrite reductase (NADH) large subunit
MKKMKLVMVGNGMAGVRTLEELLKIAPDLYDITVFGAEPHPNYNRILLSPVLAGEQTIDEIILNPLSWYADHGITLHLATKVTDVHRARRVVTGVNAQGETVEAEYDRLLIATGSNPFILPVPGKDLEGVIAYRDIADTNTMIETARTHQHAVVIGGGLLGLEAANGLARQGLSVTVVHIRGRVMDRQLDDEAATFLRRSMEARGIGFRLSARTEAFEGDSRVQRVRLEDGSVIEAGMVVVAAGITPRTGLARDCGLACDRGILVDDTLQTFDPAIYAVGECVQHRGTTYGLVAPLWEQARVCAAHLAERGVTRYRGSRPSSQLKVSGIELFSAGDPARAEGAESIRYADAAGGVYKRLWVRDNRLQAAVLYGDTRHASWYAELIEQQRDISACREQLLWGEEPAGSLA